ncbi:hypothetical protein [Conexibacter sp. SYSU D00693]|uniref:hypothetical protein n=1 Tax=Conexibacter sp. SYSU D00693 TaxID=2812560 RepID=UPI00196BA4C2|nr:hypothetical protein [Conexibacter sp. SYSU D00693]
MSPFQPNYDSAYHLVWGRDLLDGIAPGFESYAAPTEHPLWLAVCALVSVFGDGADQVLVAITLLAHLALVWAVFRLGRGVGGTWTGVLAAAFAGSSFALLLYAARAYVDTPFLALVLWAAVLEVERPRPRRTLALLALAGLLRPEAWVLSGLFLLWAARRDVRAWALAAIAPLGWAAVDLAVTGDPLFSLHATSDLADELGRPQGLAEAVRSFFTFLGGTAREPVAVLALGGAALLWRRRRERPVQVLGGLFLSGALTFGATGVAGLSVLPRYLTVPAIVLCVLGAVAAVAAWQWRRWVVVGVCVLAAPVVAWYGLDRLDRLGTELDFTRDVRADLEAVLATPEVAAGRRCGPITLPNYRLVPETRWVLHATRSEVGARSARERDRGVALFLVGDKPLRRYGFADGASPRTVVPQPGFVRAVRRGMFVAYVACPGAS